MIVELHGATGDGSLIDAHLDMMAQDEEHGFIVTAPTGPPFGFVFAVDARPSRARDRTRSRGATR